MLECVSWFDLVSRVGVGWVVLVARVFGCLLVDCCCCCGLWCRKYNVSLTVIARVNRLLPVLLNSTLLVCCLWLSSAEFCSYMLPSTGYRTRPLRRSDAPTLRREECATLQRKTAQSLFLFGKKKKKRLSNSQTCFAQPRASERADLRDHKPRETDDSVARGRRLSFARRSHSATELVAGALTTPRSERGAAFGVVGELTPTDGRSPQMAASSPTRAVTHASTVIRALPTPVAARHDHC